MDLPHPRCARGLRGAAALLAVFALVSSASAQAQTATETQTQARTQSPPPDAVYGLSIATGRVVVAGEILTPPFRVGVAGERVYVNEQVVTKLPPPPARRGLFRVGRPDGSPRASGPHDPRTAERTVGQVELDLHRGRTIVVLGQGDRLALQPDDADLLLVELAAAATAEARTQAIARFFAAHPDYAAQWRPTAHWMQVLAEFPVGPSLRRLVASDSAALLDLQMLGSDDYVQSMEGSPIEQSAEADASPAREPHVAAAAFGPYALNLIGLLLVAASATVMASRGDQPPAAAASRHLMLLAALSLFDLVATLAADRSGGFEELNPLAASLLADPFALAGFKVGAIGLAIAILHRLRTHRLAQRAALLSLAVMTLVTARWVAVWSLFYV